MVTTRFSNALNLLVAIALANGRPVSSDALSNCMGIHAVVIRRMFRGLADAGLVTVRTGLRGGAVLSRPACAITLAEVYAAVERAVAPRPHGTPCGDGVRAQVLNLCAELAHRMQVAIEGELGALTLADVAASTAVPAHAASDTA